MYVSGEESQVGEPGWLNGLFKMVIYLLVDQCMKHLNYFARFRCWPQSKTMQSSVVYLFRFALYTHYVVRVRVCTQVIPFFYRHHANCSLAHFVIFLVYWVIVIDSAYRRYCHLKHLVCNSDLTF